MTLMKVNFYSQCLYNVTESQQDNKIVFLIKWFPATISHDVTARFKCFLSAGTSENVTLCMQTTQNCTSTSEHSNEKLQLERFLGA